MAIKLDIAPNWWRFRQFAPGRCTGRYGMIAAGPNVRLVRCIVKGAWKTQSVMVSRKIPLARAWPVEHKFGKK